MTEPAQSVDDKIDALTAELEKVYTDHEIEVAVGQLPVDEQPSERAKIVFIGEVGAGKTALINAVLDRTDLPVLPTQLLFAVGAGNPERVRLRLVDGRIETVGVEELASVTVERDPADGAVDFVELVIDHPMLAQMTLFDTPGFGGLDSAATSRTLLGIEGAAALVFVCAAGEKISLAEASFLAEAASRIDHVVFVLSKVDTTDDGGAANLAENKAAITGPLPPNQVRGLTFLAVSAELAAEGGLGDTDSLAESGIESLRAVLRDIAASQHIHTQRNALRQIRQSVTTAYEVLEQRRSVLKESTGQSEALEVVTARLSKLREHRGAYETLLYRLLTQARWAAIDARDQRAEELETEYAGRVLTAKAREDFQSLEAEIVRDLDQWQKDTAADVHRRVVADSEKLTQGLVFVDIDALIQEVAETAALGRRAVDGLDEATRRARSGADALTQLQQAYFGAMMLTNLANAVAQIVVGIGGVVTLGPAMVPGGLGWLILQRYFRIQVQTRDDLAGRIQKAISKAKTVIETHTERWFTLLSWELSDKMAKGLDDAIAEAENQRKAIGQGDADRRRKQLEGIDKAGSSLDPLQRRWQTLHGELLGLTASPPAP